MEAVIVSSTGIAMTVRPMAMEIATLQLRVARVNRTDAALVLVNQITGPALVHHAGPRIRWRLLYLAVQVEVLPARIKMAMMAK